MYRVGQDNKMRKCLTASKAHIVIKELHEGVARGHFVAYITINKILDDIGGQLYSQILMNFEKANSRQKIRGLKTKSLAKMVITLPEKPFMKGGLNFIGPIKLARRLS